MFNRSQSHKLIKEVKVLIKKRGIETVEKNHVLSYSNNRTSDLNKLTIAELQAYHAALKERTPEWLINGIYCIAASLKIISSDYKRSTENDSTIVAFFKQQNIGYNKNFNDLSYIELYQTATCFANVYVKQSAEINN